MTSPADLIDICEKLRYDLTAAQGKLSDVIQALRGANIPPVEPVDPLVKIRRQIRNGAITDGVSLNAEVFGHGLSAGQDVEELHVELAARLAGGERATKTDPIVSPGRT